MVNWVKGFSTEEQKRLEELSNKYWADAVAQGIKTLWRTDEFQDRVEATKEVKVENVVEAPVETAPETVVQEAPVEEVVETVKPTAPVKEEAPVVNQTAVDTEKKMDVNDSQVRQALQLTASRGLDATESVAKVKESLERRGMDVSQFEEQFAWTISEFSQFDTSTDDFYVWLSTGQTYPSFVQKSASFKSAQELFNKVRAQDTSENGLYLGLKSNSIDPSVLSKIKNDPVVAQNITKANKRIIREDLKNGEIESLYDLPVGKQTQALEIMMEELGLNKSKAEILEQDNILSTNSQSYLKDVWELNKLYEKRKSLRRSLEAQYPNASPAFINAMYNKQNDALESQIDDLEASSSTYKTAYDFRLGELKTGFDLEATQDENKFNLFRDIQRNNFSLYLEEIKNADKETVSNFQFLSPGSGVIARTDKKTGDVKFFNTQNVWEVYNETTSNYEAETVTTAGNVVISWEGTDLRGSNYVSKYPNNASFKNNNPAGLTFTATSQALKDKFKSFGIGITEGTDRPSNEGGSYISFNTLNDGLDAMKISFYETGFSDVKTRLMAWKGAGTEAEKEAYANDIIEATFGDTENREFDNMSDLDKEKLLTQHLKREDWALYNVLNDEIGAIREDGTLDYSLLKTNWQSSAKWFNEKINWVDVVLWAIWVPVVFERTIKSQIQATLLNSEVELEQANNTIKALYNAGYSPEMASQVFQGFEIRDQKNISIWTGILKYYRNIIQKPEGALWTLSAQLNTNNKLWAIEYVEGVLQREIKELNPEAPTRAETKLKISRYNDVLSDIPDDVGVVSGTIDNFLKRLWDSWRKAFYTKLAILNTEEQRRIFGAQVTGNEKDDFAAIKLENNDQVSTLIAKIGALKSDSMLKLNSYRGYKLPALSERELLDWNALVSLYEWEEENEQEIIEDKNYNDWDKEDGKSYNSLSRWEAEWKAEWYNIEENIEVDKSEEEKNILHKFADMTVINPATQAYNWTLSFIKSTYNSANKTANGAFKMLDKASLASANIVREIIWKEPLSMEEAKQSWIATAWGLETSLSEDLLDVWGWSLELWLSAYFPTSSLIINVAAEDDSIATVLNGIGWVITEWGRLVNKLPGLSNYRDSLPEDRRKDFDVYVWQLASAWLIKASSSSYQYVINKYKTDSATATARAVRPTKSEVETGIANGAENGINRAISNAKTKPETYPQLNKSINKELISFEKNLNTKISKIDKVLKSKWEVTFWGKHPSVKWALDQLKEIYAGSKGSDSRATLAVVNDLLVKYNKWTIATKDIQNIKRLHTSSNSIFTEKWVERWTMNAKDLASVRRDLKGLVEENWNRAWVDIKTINTEYSELLNASTITKQRMAQVQSYKSTLAETNVIQKILANSFKTIKAWVLELLNRRNSLSILEAEQQIIKIARTLKKSWTSQSKIDLTVEKLREMTILSANAE